VSAVAVETRRVRVESFGERLRRLRVARGVSCAQLAHRVGVTEGAIRQMESGQTKMASFVIGLRLAKELGTDAWYLANGVADDAEAQAGADGIVLRVSALEQQIASLLEDRTRGA
jgi:transcriptional regulator with XRE-family HTH domain